VFYPIKLLQERVETARQDSDSSFFLALMSLAEFVTKTTAAGMVAAIMNDKNRHRYRQLHRLVRADGIGEWSDCLNEVLTGPASQFLQRQARTEQRELTQRFKTGSWQYEAVAEMDSCLLAAGVKKDELPTKVDGRRWFSMFAELRNKTVGHGVVSPLVCGKIAPPLARSLSAFLNNFALFQREWVFLHRNISGKYRITKLSDSTQEFEYLKGDRTAKLANGVYLCFDRPSDVELITSDADRTDFYVPNGAFNGKRFEMLSYITGQKFEADAAPYLAPSTPVPALSPR
jgi:hypothetical protein